ncbi:MAG TPA: YetF domain-containing protein [Fimbriimonadaceae bacterium]|nr:YetF domain-containing protein [Fimbriimonadaceae bacterium]
MPPASFFGHVVLSTLLIYVWLILMLRFVGRRELALLTPIDLLLIVLLGSAVETSMVGASTELPIGIVSALTLFVANRLITALFARFAWLRKAVGGQPVLIVHDGKIVEKQARRLGLSDEEILEALHEREQCRIEECRFAVFEPDGEINAVPYSRKVLTTQ